MKKTMAALMAFGLSTTAMAGGVDDPLVYRVMLDKLEIRGADGDNPLVWDAQAWIGYDLNKFWIKAEGERVDGKTEEADIELLYSRALAPFWDLQAGWRRDIEPTPDRDWLALSLKGLAPYLFEVDASLYIGESGRIATNLDAEYEYMFTQRLILSPEIEINLYSDRDAARGIGSGLSNLEAGLRLRYEIRREFAPYIGVNWTRLFGGTADFADAEGGDTSDLQWVAGIRAWF